MHACARPEGSLGPEAAPGRRKLCALPDCQAQNLLTGQHQKEPIKLCSREKQCMIQAGGI